MSTVFSGKGAFLLNYFANKPTCAKVKRMSRHPKAQEEPEPHKASGALSRILDSDRDAPTLDCTGPEFDFTTPP